MKRKILSLTLALAMCLSLAVPASAAGTTEKVTDEKYGIVVTMNDFLRKEVHRYDSYDGYTKITIYVVADNSTVKVEAMDGRRYGSPIETMSDEEWEHFEENMNLYAYCDPSATFNWFSETNQFGAMGSAYEPLTESTIYTAAPAEDRISMISSYYPVCWLCESDFAKLVPFEGEINASAWAKETLENAYDALLFPDAIDPFVEDCTRGMTRAEFAAVALNLYVTFADTNIPSLPATAGINSNHPFSDVQFSVTEANYNTEVGYAYNLGLIAGTSETTFSPDETLTREQAAAILARVYAKIYGDIPSVTATSFADDSSVGSWAKSSVAFMADKGIISGVGNNSFAPQQTLSIQEAMSMAQRMLENLK